MAGATIVESTSLSEVNLVGLINKILERKLFFVVSLLLCIALAFIYIKTLHPIYEVQTSLLIDRSGKSKMLGESKYVEGSIGLFESEKNLNNEMGILRSYRLIERTIKELDFDISYYSSNLFRSEEQYNSFPFKVVLTDSSSQLYHTPFYVEILSDEQFRLSIESNAFLISNPTTGVSKLVEKELQFSDIFNFGEIINHQYFNFSLKKSDGYFNTADLNVKELFFKLNSIDNLTKSYKARLKVEQANPEASILNIRVSGTTVKKEIEFLEKLTRNFIDTKYLERDKIEATKENFIRAQLTGITDSLTLAEKELEQFKKGANAVDLGQSSTIALENLQKLETERSQIELNIKYYASLLEYLRAADGIEKIVAPSVVGIDDPLLNENLLELKKLNSQKTRLQFYKGAKSYDIEAINQQIESTSKSLQENLRNLKATTELSLRDKINRIRKLERVINRLPGNEKKLLNFQRKNTLYENLYNYLNQELAKTTIARAVDIPDTKVLDDPRMIGTGPIAPQKKLILALAGILGLLFPLLWILISEGFKNTIQDAHQIKTNSAIPLLANIHHYDNHSNATKNVISLGLVEESFRELAAKLQFTVRDKQKNSIGITSSIDGEGKTFCSVKLGIALANEGKRVLIIDLNMRNPEILSSIGTQGEKGISNEMLVDINSFKNIIHVYKGLSNLHYIPAEKQDNPHKLISSDRLKTLITKLKSRYDYIILDTPSFNLYSDYLLISQFVDIHLFIVRRNVSKTSFFAEMEAFKNTDHSENIFLVFNDVID